MPCATCEGGTLYPPKGWDHPYNEYILKDPMTTSNLSKIKPKLRTQGVVSGNFGKAKVKAGSPLRDIGVTNAKVVKVNTQDDYLKRLYAAYDTTNDPKLKQFAYTEIRKILIQRGEW
jgi:hypothetical protein